MRKPRLSRAVVSLALAGLAACASSAPKVDWTQVHVVEKNREGMEHLALPEEMEGCKYLGPVRASIPSSVDHAAPEVVLESLQREAAKKGGDTLAVLPGMRAIGRTVRGSVFLCSGS
jgi:hypothetical protein